MLENMKPLIFLTLLASAIVACSDDPAPAGVGDSVVEQAQALCPSFCDAQIRCSQIIAPERDGCIAACRQEFFGDLPSNCALDEDAATACANALSVVSCEDFAAEDGLPACDNVRAIDLSTGGECIIETEDAGNDVGSGGDGGGGNDGGGGGPDAGGGEDTAGGGDTGGEGTGEGTGGDAG